MDEKRTEIGEIKEQNNRKVKGRKEKEKLCYYFVASIAIRVTEVRNPPFLQKCILYTGNMAASVA